MDAFYMTRITEMLDDEYPSENTVFTIYCNRGDVPIIKNLTHGMNVTIIPETHRRSWIIRWIVRWFQTKFQKVFFKVVMFNA